MSTRPISLLGFETIREDRDALLACLDAVLDSGQIHSADSAFVAAFEARFAERVGTTRSVAVSSGSEALALALDVLGLPSGGEVLLPAFTFQATAAAVVRADLTPRFVDIDPDTLQLDPGAVEAAITASTVALLPVHLFGIPAPIETLCAIAAEHGLEVVEDAAQAIGAQTAGGAHVGSYGRLGCFSTSPTKALGGLGEGGVIALDDELLDARLRRLRHNGALRGFWHEAVGRNAMMDSLQASFLSMRLQRLDEELAHRRALAGEYAGAFAGDPRVRLVSARPGDRAAPSKLTILLASASRERVREQLAAEGIETAVYYPRGLHRQPCFADLAPVALPVTDAVAERALSLPIHGRLPLEAARSIAASVLAALEPATVQRSESKVR
jgi:dTDP-4-amino-4,6-dideoxygalactose transaminase